MNSYKPNTMREYHFELKTPAVVSVTVLDTSHTEALSQVSEFTKTLERVDEVELVNFGPVEPNTLSK